MATADTYIISSAGKATIKKDPDAILDYSWDWTAYLATISDTISSVTFTLTSPATTTPLVKTAQSNTSLIAKAFLSGGTLGATETCTCRIVTAGGRTDDRTIYLKIVAK